MRSGLLLSAVAAASLLLGGASASAQTTVAGITPGSLAVDETGAANYRLPIQVPPGVAGLSPDLSLLYRSRKKNGALGVGWVLDGVSVIERCARTIAQDGARGGIDYSGDDRFCLDKERLVSVGAGTYGANGSEYRTEIESFSKIVSYNLAGTGPEHFKVWTKSGQILEYGATADSRVEVPGQADVRYWALNKVSDRYGNEMTFSYAEDTMATSATENTHKLTRIDYGGNSIQGTLAQASVRFTYEARTDTRVSYVAQARSQMLERLKSIETYSGATLVKSYNLAYDASITTKRSRLKSVTECDGDFVTANCLAPAEFVYSDMTAGTNIWEEDVGYLPPFVVDDRKDEVNRGRLIDVDGDGLVDFVQAYRNAGGTSVQKVWLNTGSDWAENVGYKPPFVIEDKKDDLRRGELADVNGDGLPDFVRAYRQSNGTSVQKTWLNTGSGWAENVGYKPTFVIEDKSDGVRRGELIDVNGDGRIDFLRAYRNASGTSVQKVLLNTGSGWAENVGYKPPFVIEDKKDDLRRGELADVNGDGLPDFVRAYRQSNGTSVQKTWLNTGSGWAENVGYKPPFVIEDKKDDLRRGELVDVNGDGLPDFVRAYRQSNGTSVQKTWLNTGIGWTENVGYKPPFVIEDKSENLKQGEFAEFNGDGLPDFARAYRLANGTEVKKTWLNTGTGWAESVDHLMPDIIDDRADDVRRQAFADVNGDGARDWVRAYRLANGTSVQKVWLNNSGVPDTLTSVTDSLGRVASLTYKPLTADTVYSKETGATFPERDIQVPARVVSQISRDDGIGGQKLTDYTYAGGRYHDQGRKFLGFREMMATDVQTGNVTTTTYERNYRYSGFVKENKIATASGALLEKTTNTWASTETAVTDQPNIVFPYLFSSTTERYEINDGVGNLPLITETVTNTFDTYGNPILVVGTTSGNGETFTTTTTNSFTNDTADWLLGLRTRTEVTKSRTPGTAATRTMTWAYNVAGYVTQEVIEPDDVDHRLTRDYSYDLFGNHTGTEVSGGDIDIRDSSVSYDGNGLLPVSASNALDHAETRVMDARFGVTTSLQGPNLLTSTWLYDGFGRQTKEIRADGTETHISYALCSDASTPCATGPAGAVYSVATQDFVAAGSTATNGKSIAYFDKLNRNIRTETEGFDGTAIYVDSKYNARGFIEEVSRPYYAGTAALDIKWTHTDYDIIGRRLNLIEPDSRYFTTSYDGFKTVNTNPRFQVEDRITNAIGELVSSRDHLDAISAYSYDPFGNLISTDVEGHVTAMTYDIRGNKISMDDPDMGLWTYTHDVLGQLLTQTDAKSQMVTQTYDKLGRQTSRIELEGTTIWTYDNATMGVGKIHQISGPNGYLQVQGYDSLGRPDQTTRTISGTTYQTSMTYDAASRESTRTYPSGFVVQNNYNARGYLDSVSEVLGGTVYWQANAVSAEGKVTQETLGNGVVTTRTYDPAQNLVQSIQSSSGATTIQDLSFVFDQMGNLTERQDLHRDRTEAFGYDDRNQLTSAVLSETSTASALNTTSYSYNLIGNITNKSDVGNYLYGANGAGPHAVTSVTDDIGNVLSSYSYDANGGMTAGAGRNITWTSFRKPQLITDSFTNNSTSFVYGPDRARIQQTAVTLNVGTTTTYIGNTYEQRSRLNEPDELVHYIRASDTVAIFTRIDDGSALTDKTRYLHRDHIYSVETITDELGAITEHYSYDAHGKRRFSNWLPGNPATPSETPRGFTGHEHLDGVGLIHMNGRVYAPELGRMLSPDPYVQVPQTPKGFNRYAYVFNNPLSFTDPSGFFVGGHSDPFGGGDDNRGGEENRGGGPGSEGNDGLGGGGAYGGPGGNTGGNSPGANSGDPGDQSDFGKNYTGRSYGNGVVDGQGKDTRRGRFSVAELAGLDKDPRVGSPYARSFVVTVPTGIVIGAVTLEKVGWVGLIAILSSAATLTTVDTIAKMEETPEEEKEKPLDEKPVENPDVTPELKDLNKISKGRIKEAEKQGFDAEEIKGELNMSSKEDLFSDKDGNVYAGAKNGTGEATPTGVNINDYLGGD